MILLWYTASCGPLLDRTLISLFPVCKTRYTLKCKIKNSPASHPLALIHAVYLCCISLEACWKSQDRWGGSFIQCTGWNWQCMIYAFLLCETGIKRRITFFQNRFLQIDVRVLRFYFYFLGREWVLWTLFLSLLFFLLPTSHKAPLNSNSVLNRRGLDSCLFKVHQLSSVWGGLLEWGSPSQSLSCLASIAFLAPARVRKRVKRLTWTLILWEAVCFVTTRPLDWLAA